MEDPDPRVDGGGHAQLQAAGLEVSTGVMASQAARDHRGFVTRVRHGRPMVTLKLATSLDGRIATATGESQWITGPAARRLGHALRARHDAVMVGAGTARADDPTLTVRGLGAVAQPVRIVVSGDLDLSVPSNLTRTQDQAPLWAVYAADAPPDRIAALGATGATLLPVARAGAGGMAASDILSALGAAGLTRVFCEGGGGLAATLLKADLVDEMVLFSGGAVIGGDGRPSIGALGLGALLEAPRFTLLDQHQVGGDPVSVWVRSGPA
jgi:diaminohydroxyphosphoribosylaminopyrimidine deaminase/5-amino-6-(5-phosphoribosylamino)uracil reductase